MVETEVVEVRSYLREKTRVKCQQQFQIGIIRLMQLTGYIRRVSLYLLEKANNKKYFTSVNNKIPSFSDYMFAFTTILLSYSTYSIVIFI